MGDGRRSFVSWVMNIDKFLEWDMGNFFLASSFWDIVWLRVVPVGGISCFLHVWRQSRFGWSGFGGLWGPHLNFLNSLLWLGWLAWPSCFLVFLVCCFFFQVEKTKAVLVVILETPWAHHPQTIVSSSFHIQPSLEPNKRSWYHLTNSKGGLLLLLLLFLYYY